MPAPVLAVAAGVVGGVATGFVIDKVFGDGNYTRNEMVTDAILGGAGVGMLKHIGKLGRSHGRFARVLSNYDPRVDILSDIPVVYLMTSGKEVFRAGTTAATIVAVGSAVEAVGGRSLSSKPTPTVLTTVSKYKSGKVSSKRSRKRSRKFTPMKPKYCSLHKKYDYCYRK